MSHKAVTIDNVAFLMRVELPDIPGSLGSLATALGTAGADIEAIEIVEHRADGKALDDVLLELPPTVMPDELITACQKLDGVRVHWISRYDAGVNLSMDLEAIETFTHDPTQTLSQLVEVLPATFRTDWAIVLRANGDDVELLHASPSAPKLVPEALSWVSINEASTIPEARDWEETLLAGAPGKDRTGNTFTVIVGRHGGPEFIPSELARLGHMVSLAASVYRAG